MSKQIKDIFIFCVTLLLHTTITQGQTFNINGTVIDSLTREKIEFANVILLASDSSFYAGVTPDSMGNFVFSAKENKLYILKVSCIGYNSKILSVKSNQFIEVELSQNQILLNEILVKGQLDIIKHNTANLIFRVTDMMREDAFLATHILEKIPTVYVDFNNKIYVNGHGNILILQNGIELPNTTLINQISPQTIERIEISRMVPTKYLNRGIASVINIITKRVEKKNLKLHTNLSPNKLYDADVNFNLDKRKHSLYIYYKLYYRNFLENKTINNAINDMYNTFRLQTKPRKEFDNEFFYGYSYNPNSKIVIGLDGYLSLYNEYFQTQSDVNNNLTEFSLSKIYFTTQNYSSFLQYKDSTNEINARVNLNNKKVNSKISYFQSSGDKNEDDNYNFSAEIDYSKKFSETLKLNTGINYNYLNNHTEFSYLQQDNNYHFTENGISGFVDINKDFDNLSLLLGVNIFARNKYFQNDNLNIESTYFSPKFSGIYSFDDHNSIMLDFYSSQNLPSLWQLMAIPVNVTPNYMVKGNPYLKPENITNLSFEYSYSKGSTYYSSTLFYKKAKHKITDEYSMSENKLISSKINLDNCNDFGVSSSFSNSIFDWWTVRMNLDVFNKHIPENKYYKKNLASVDASITNVFNYKRKLMLAVRYGYNGRRLTYNGYLKPYNNSLAQLRYTVNKNLNLSLIWIQPIDAYKSESMTYYNNKSSYSNNINQIETSTVLFSFTYNILNDQIKKNAKTYNNEDRKY